MTRVLEIGRFVNAVKTERKKAVGFAARDEKLDVEAVAERLGITVVERKLEIVRFA